MKKIFHLACIALTALAMASCTPQNEGFVRVEGTKLVNPDGTQFFVKGTNLGNWLNPEGYMFRFPGNVNSPTFINDGLCQMVGPGYMKQFWTKFVENYVTEKDIEFLEADRSSYHKIRAARPDQDRARAILDAYLENTLFENCTINEGYITAQGFKVK